MDCLQPRGCTFHPGNFTDWGGEGVKEEKKGEQTWRITPTRQNGGVSVLGLVFSHRGQRVFWLAREVFHLTQDLKRKRDRYLKMRHQFHVTTASFAQYIGTSTKYVKILYKNYFEFIFVKSTTKPPQLQRMIDWWDKLISWSAETDVSVIREGQIRANYSSQHHTKICDPLFVSRITSCSKRMTKTSKNPGAGLRWRKCQKAREVKEDENVEKKRKETKRRKKRKFKMM